MPLPSSVRIDIAVHEVEEETSAFVDFELLVALDADN